MKNIIIKIGLIVSLLIVGIPAFQTAHAYQIDPSFRPNNVPFALESDIKERGAAGATVLILQIIAGALLYFAGPIATIMIIISASQMVVQGNEPEKIEQAKKNLTWSAVGLLLIILSYSIVRIILSFVIGAGTPSTT